LYGIALKKLKWSWSKYYIHVSFKSHSGNHPTYVSLNDSHSLKSVQSMVLINVTSTHNITCRCFFLRTQATVGKKACFL